MNTPPTGKFDPHPPRIVVDADGYVWRDYGDYYSMCPVTDGNGPMSEPLMVYEPAHEYGFNWGPMVVERVAHVEGRGYCVSIRGRTDYAGPEIQVLVSEKGRSVTAYPIRGAKSKQARTNTEDTRR